MLTLQGNKTSVFQGPSQAAAHRQDDDERFSMAVKDMTREHRKKLAQEAGNSKMGFMVLWLLWNQGRLKKNDKNMEVGVGFSILRHLNHVGFFLRFVLFLSHLKPLWPALGLFLASLAFS